MPSSLVFASIVIGIVTVIAVVEAEIRSHVLGRRDHVDANVPSNAGDGEQRAA
jgi:hypothetical protein